MGRHLNRVKEAKLLNVKVKLYVNSADGSGIGEVETVVQTSSLPGLMHTLRQMHEMLEKEGGEEVKEEKVGGTESEEEEVVNFN